VSGSPGFSMRVELRSRTGLLSRWPHPAQHKLTTCGKTQPGIHLNGPKRFRSYLQGFGAKRGVFLHNPHIGLTKGIWSPALELLREKYVAKCYEAECEVNCTEMTGGEFEWSHIKAIDSSPLARQRWKAWDFYEEDTIVGQLVGKYVDGTGVMENPLTGDIEQILLDGPQELEGEDTTPSSEM